MIVVVRGGGLVRGFVRILGALGAGQGLSITLMARPMSFGGESGWL